MHLTLVPWDFYLILVFLGTIVPWRGAVRITQLLAKPTLAARERLSLYATTILYQWLLAADGRLEGLWQEFDSAGVGLTVSDPWRITLIALVVIASALRKPVGELQADYARPRK